MTATSKARLFRVAASALSRSGLLMPLTRVAGYAVPAVFQVLTYHRVNDDDDPFFPALPTAIFEAQMRHLAQAYRVLTVEELTARARVGTLPRNAVAVTFDDGYRDTLTHAAPILARYGLPATIFLATGFIGTGQASWFDRLALAFKATEAQSVLTPWGVMPLGSPTQRLDALARTVGALKSLADRDARETATALVEALSVSDDAPLKNLMLSWDDVHALIELGLSIGAHTVTHPILSRVTAERAWAEIVGSRRTIETVCGRAPDAFAYPNGRPDDYTAAVVSQVSRAGFTCAVTTRFGMNTTATPVFELRRGGPWERDLPSFAMKLAVYRIGIGQAMRRGA